MKGMPRVLRRRGGAAAVVRGVRTRRRAAAGALSALCPSACSLALGSKRPALKPTPQVPVGVDPKSIVCEFFRHGQVRSLRGSGACEACEWLVPGGATLRSAGCMTPPPHLRSWRSFPPLQCQKGFKCKFSHDLNVERKTAKIDLYSDRWGRWRGASSAAARAVESGRCPAVGALSRSRGAVPQSGRCSAAGPIITARLPGMADTASPPQARRRRGR